MLIRLSYILTSAFAALGLFGLSLATRHTGQAAIIGDMLSLVIAVCIAKLWYSFTIQRNTDNERINELLKNLDRE